MNTDDCTTMLQDHKAIVADQKAIERWESEGGRALALAAANSNASDPYFSEHVYWDVSDGDLEEKGISTN